jgi:serine protease inhibitor
MVIVIPNKTTGLALLEDKLMTTEISELLKETDSEKIELFLPKFTIETTLDLEKALGTVCSLMTA